MLKFQLYVHMARCQRAPSDVRNEEVLHNLRQQHDMEVDVVVVRRRQSLIDSDFCTTTRQAENCALN